MEKFDYKITINAPRKKVWDIMLQPETYKEWSGAAWPGSFYEGDWKQGNIIRFIGEGGGGTLVSLPEVEEYHYVLAKHIAMLREGGVEDRDSKEAKGWIGSTEAYTFTDRDGGIELVIDIVANPEWKQMFNDWTIALEKLKEMCER